MESLYVLDPSKTVSYKETALPILIQCEICFEMNLTNERFNVNICVNTNKEIYIERTENNNTVLHQTF